jgi:hypothetical protein
MPIYNAIVFTGDINIGNKGFVKYRKINNLNRFNNFINEKYPEWKFYNLYDHKTKQKIDVIKSK